MKRREAIKAMGAGLIGVPAVDVLSRKVTTDRTAVINIYQNEDLTEFFKSRSRPRHDPSLSTKQGRNKQDPKEMIETQAQKDQEPIEYTVTEFTEKKSRRAVEKFDAYFDNVRFELNFGDFDIPLDLGSDVNKLSSELDYLKKWMKYETDTPKSNESNILLVPDFFSGSSGVATTPVIPKFSLYDGHGIVWVNPNQEKAIHRIIAHEVGHTVGLQHFHGTILEGDYRSIMYSKKYARNVGRNVYGSSLKPIPKKEKFVFNPKISEDSLRI